MSTEKRPFDLQALDTTQVIVFDESHAGTLLLDLNRHLTYYIDLQANVDNIILIGEEVGRKFDLIVTFPVDNSSTGYGITFPSNWLTNIMPESWPLMGNHLMIYNFACVGDDKYFMEDHGGYPLT